jgi:hypothetical protein
MGNREGFIHVIFLQTNWIIAFVCAYIFLHAGRLEARGSSLETRSGSRDNGILWAGLSIATSALVIQVFGGGWLFVLLAQAGLFIGIGIYRAWRE